MMKASGEGYGAGWGAIFWVGVLAFLVGSGAAPGPAMSDGVAGSAEVPGDWWSQVQRDLSSQEYQVTWQEQCCIEGLGAGWHAPNRAQNLRTYFTSEGPRVVRRTDSEPTWVWGVELVGFRFEESPSPGPPRRTYLSLQGRGRNRLPASHRGKGIDGEGGVCAVTDITTNGNRIQFQRGGRLTEWYVNDPKGLEQGFTIGQIPPQSPLSEGGKAACAPLVEGGLGGIDSDLVIELALRGNLIPNTMPDGETIEFLTEGGVGIIHYGSLRAWDAEGRDLPARMTLTDNTVALRVEVSDAVYPVTIDPLASSAAWVAEGNQVGANFGTSVSTAGDVNGDGFADVIVGADDYDGGETDEGGAFVYYGSAAGLLSVPTWAAEGNQADAEFGVAVSTAGDVNGDGYADVIVGAHYYDNGESNEGRAYVYHGSASGLSSSPDWTAESDQENAWLGSSVSTAGDVNGDGYGDIVVGAHYYDNVETDEGRAYVYHGSASGLSSSPDWIAESDRADAHFGFSVSTAGDVNGDDYDDLIVGMPNYSNGEITEGRANVYHGSASGLSTSADWSCESNALFASFASSVSAAGDIDGDGYDEVIIGAPHFDSGQAYEGMAFVYQGSASGLSASPYWTAESNQADAWFGSSVSTAGDVDGDGYADVIVGALYYNNGETDEGGAFLYCGSASGLPGAPDWSAESDQTGAEYGCCASTAGDVNGDGYADIVVGSHYYSNGESSEGRAYVYHGSASGLPVSEWETY